MLFMVSIFNKNSICNVTEPTSIIMTKMKLMLLKMVTMIMVMMISNDHRNGASNNQF